MKRRASDILLGLLLCTFLNFVFSNTVFLHTHHGLDGRTVSHSHPYLPSAPDHGHSAMSLDNIAALNASVASMEGSESFMPEQYTAKCTIILVEADESITDASKADIAQRGPPAA